MGPIKKSTGSLSRSVSSVNAQIAMTGLTLESYSPASSSTVLHSNITRSGTLRCGAFCTREAICVASSEWPPTKEIQEDN
jgi:hypothetical protein